MRVEVAYGDMGPRGHVLPFDGAPRTELGHSGTDEDASAGADSDLRAPYDALVVAKRVEFLEAEPRGTGT